MPNPVVQKAKVEFDKAELANGGTFAKKTIDGVDYLCVCAPIIGHDTPKKVSEKGNVTTARYTEKVQTDAGVATINLNFYRQATAAEKANPLTPVASPRAALRSL